MGRQQLTLGFFAGCLMLVALLFRWPVKDYQGWQNGMVLICFSSGLAYLLWRVNPWVSILFVWVTLRGFNHTGTYGYFLAGAVWYYFLVTEIEDIEPILNMIAILAIINCVFMPLQNVAVGRYLGVTGNENFLAALFAMSLPAFFRKTWWLWLFLIIPALILTKTFGGYLSAGAGLVYYMFAVKWRFRWVAIIVLFECFVILMLKVDGPGLERIDIWFITMMYAWHQNFWFGAGLGCYEAHKHMMADIVRYTRGIYWNHPHSELIKSTYELGIISLPIISAVFWSFRKNRAVIPMTAMVIVFVNMQVNFPLYVGATAILAVTWMAIVTITHRRQLAIDAGK